jgi:hypothetical protein
MGRLQLTAYTIGHTASDCRLALRDLRRQTIAAELAVLVVTSDPSTLDPALQTGFGDFQFLVLESITSSGQAMAAAVRAAKTPFVTYAEEHSHFAPDWAERLLAAHTQGRHDIVGFAMENANPGPISWAHLYGQFGPAVAPVTPCEETMLAGHHISYRREFLLEFGDLLPDMMEDESALCLNYRAKGGRLWMAGDARSWHVQVSTLEALMALDFHGHRTFASSRWQSGGWGMGKRILYAAACPLIPLVRLRRIVHHLRRTGRFGSLIGRIAGPILAMTAAGMAGECLGYLSGAGGSAAARLPLEVQREEFLAETDSWSKLEARK